jgi:hypothetical protein
VILLVTDGVPEAPVTTTCQPRPSIEDAEAAASECAAAPNSIPTYVVGVGGNLDNLSRLAAAGGTGEAYLVGPNPEVTADVLAALNQIRSAAQVPCEFTIPDPPPGETLNPGLVNVTYQDTRGDDNVIPSVGSADTCTTAGGWFYDDPANPSSVRLCPATCDVVTATLIAGNVTGRTARIDLSYGCETVVITM